MDIVYYCDRKETQNKMRLQALVIVASVVLSCKDQSVAAQSYSNANKFPNLNVCGRSEMAIGAAIVGGEDARLGEFPWMANIGYRKSGQSGAVSWLCGGSLITDQHVITAAHCLHPSVLKTGVGWLATEWKVVEVQLGELNMDPNVKDGAKPKSYAVENVIYHQQYDNSIKENDIGLIKLKDKVVFTELMRPICLPSVALYREDFVGDFPTVAGWGNTFESRGNTKVPQLQEVAIEVRNREECKRNLTSLPNMKNNIIDEKVLCAGSPGKDACQGDSGGPLMYFFQEESVQHDGNWFLIGVVSYGHGCAREGYPGIYARVSEYMRWIDENLRY